MKNFMAHKAKMKNIKHVLLICEKSPPALVTPYY